MKIAFLADLHVSEDRIDEHVEILRSVAGGIVAGGPDLVLVGGDLCGRRTPHRATPTERNAIVEFVVAVGEVAPVIVVRGNHDAPGDWDFLERLRVDVTYVSDGPECVEGDGWSVLVLPWIDRSAFGGRGYHEGVRGRYKRAIEEFRSGLLTAREGGAETFLLGHVALAGAMARDGRVIQTDDPLVSLSDLACSDGGLWSGVFLGHYHVPQDVVHTDPTVVYSGSTTANEYGDGRDKSWVLWDDGRIERRSIDVVVRLVLDVDGESGEVVAETPAVGIDGVCEGVVPRMHVKVRVHVGESRLLGPARVVARQWYARLHEYVLSCATEFVMPASPPNRDGAVEVAQSLGLTEKVAAYLRLRDPRPMNGEIDAALRILEEFGG